MWVQLMKIVAFSLSLNLCNVLDKQGGVPETTDIRDEQTKSTTCRGRKRIKRNVVRKKIRLRKNQY